MPTGKGPLRIAIEDFIEGFDLTEIIWRPFKTIIERLEDEAVELYDRVAQESELEPYLPNWIRQGSIGSRSNPRPVQLAPILLGIGMMVVGMMIGALAPAQRLGSYKVDRLVKSGRPSPIEAWAMARRISGAAADPSEALRDLGMSDDIIEGYKLISQPLLTAFEYQVAWRRGIITEGELETLLIKIGYRPEDVIAIEKLGDAIPPITDLIRMQVRDAFRDDIAQRYGYDEGDTDFVKEWAAKQGLSGEWVQKYWRAHWDLPSVSQVFEMMHRLRPGTTDDPVTADEVSQFLGLADYAPGWRKRLMAISYAPFTRVDVRRMYKTGVLNEAQVKEAYLDLGYNDEKAQALTQFTIAYEAEEETGVVRSSVTAAYRDGMIDRGSASGMLLSGGYDATTTSFYLDSIDFSQSLEVKQIKLTNIKKRFVEGLIDESQVNGEINLLDLPAERVTALLELWTTERENQTALLSITQMETLLEKGIVTEDDYRRIATRRGYTSETIEWTLKRIAQEAADAAQKAAEKAEADNERLQKSKVSSQYQKDKAEVDVNIAQARAEITDIDVAKHGDIDDETIASLDARKDELKQFIASMNVVKAQLRFDTQSIFVNNGVENE